MQDDILKAMKRLVLSALLLCTLAVNAQEKGTWRALSKTARSITGDIMLSDEHISIDFTSFTIAQIKPLSAGEAAAAFNPDSPLPAGSGNLYRLNIAGAKKFLGKNTLCGAEDTQWMATYVSGKTLQVAFFSGESIPVLTPEAVVNATNLCGTYTYIR